MTDQRLRIHSAETRTEALQMYRDGLTPRQIAARLCVPYEAVRYWCDYTDGKIVPKAKPAKRKGSGVIAGPTYRKGYRWGSSVL